MRLAAARAPGRIHCAPLSGVRTTLGSPPLHDRLRRPPSRSLVGAILVGCVTDRPARTYAPRRECAALRFFTRAPYHSDAPRSGARRYSERPTGSTHTRPPRGYAPGRGMGPRARTAASPLPYERGSRADTEISCRRIRRCGISKIKKYFKKNNNKYGTHGA